MNDQFFSISIDAYASMFYKVFISNKLSTKKQNNKMTQKTNFRMRRIVFNHQVYNLEKIISRLWKEE